MRVKKLSFLLLTGFFSIAALAQDTSKTTQPSERIVKKQERRDKINQLIRQEEEGALIYSKQTAFGFKLNTDGWGVSYEHGKYKTLKKTSVWWIEAGERKSPKEEKLSGGIVLNGVPFLVGSPFIYGKQNNFYYLKLGLGQQLLIGGKGNKNGVAVSALYGGGLSIGYLKPYYLNIRNDQGQNQSVKYQDSTAKYFLDFTTINGSSGFTKGFFEGTVVPGAFARVALRFDYGRYNEFLSALEVGINAEYYSKDMPIMIDNPAKKFFYNGYVAIEFGNRK